MSGGDRASDESGARGPANPHGMGMSEVAGGAIAPVDRKAEVNRSSMNHSGALGSVLNYEVKELRFGTSGRRGKVVDLTQLEVYLNALAEMEYLQSLPAAEGGIVRGDDFYIAMDLRPSSTALVPSQGGRGEIAQAIVAAIRDAGMKPVNLGRIPTPALMSYAVAHGRGSIMVTGSHIPFDRNGYKTNSSRGELRKEEEEPIGRQVARVRDRLYRRPIDQSIFDRAGMLKAGRQELPVERCAADLAYRDRYLQFFQGLSLAGMRLLLYEHSAVGRDMLSELLLDLGAKVVRAGRSDNFVPIDTENIDAAQLASIQALADGAGGHFDAIVSTDGDSDRPLILGVHRKTGKAQFFGGDLAGMLVAEYLGADAVVVPISCNDAIDRGELAPALEPKTRIGSPFVIAGMEAALRKGRRRVCGWEPNGGFLTGSDFEKDGVTLSALPTRDAVLPILAVLFAAKAAGASLVELFARLPRRYSRAALLKDFPRSTSLRIVAALSPSGGAAADEQQEEQREIRELLGAFFRPEMRFSAVDRVDYTDGVRIFFTNGEIAHLRPSGNADELRIYAVADTQSRADSIAAMGVAEPDGILRRMEYAFSTRV